MHGCECTPELTDTCSSAWGWTHRPLQMSVCPSSHLLSSTLQCYVQFHPGFPLLLIPLLSAVHRWTSFRFLPRAIYYRNQLSDDRQLTVVVFKACAL